MRRHGKKYTAAATKRERLIETGFADDLHQAQAFLGGHGGLVSGTTGNDQLRHAAILMTPATQERASPQAAPERVQPDDLPVDPFAWPAGA